MANPRRRKRKGVPRPGKMVRIPLDVHAKLVERARQEHRPVSWELERILREVLQIPWPPGTPEEQGPAGS
jgi:hypothetical protein